MAVCRPTRACPRRAGWPKNGLARNTVLEVYEQLLAEGYLRARRGAGSLSKPACYAPPAPRLSAPWRLSQRGRTLIDCGPTPLALDGAFAPGVPALSAFPRQRWQPRAQSPFRHAPAHWLGYQAPGGLPALREALAAYLGQSRRVRCQPEQLLITGGAQPGIWIGWRGYWPMSAICGVDGRSRLSGRAQL